MTRQLPLRWIGAAVAASVALAGCGTGDPPARTGERTPAQTDRIRHDLEPLASRFPEIGDPISATWIGGALGVATDTRVSVPGPSAYIVEAIIDLQPSTADALRRKYAPAAVGETPDLDDRLAAYAPSGPFLTGAALNEALSNTDWRSAAYLQDGSDTLVLRSFDD
ncbi:hypothetical protein [Mycolicibacterium brumae]|uniref:Uncharacterized protein n=1 Tax=Mycolicibacterium brumae TaxID=85968 RepID=A0A2G5P4V4_9MYCO|nr:hypothetical protein [Mycolicibacterium brumae]MCV7193854.1 hypothetical protein [Mycolicibacterium brumae]PIB73325.1 hypothetical protein CQY22_017390 [Mycolicibacterium brumae]RWA18049.1 hypothetical protein MBRU_18085 [Mycolicibacterium brumae DSM 44177]UWW08861.1 hypothetical protein L2Z93_001933 [Mycolicibacterium brumae]